MAENKKSFVLYTDIIHVFANLTDAEAGKLIKHLLAYVNDENPKTDDRIIQIAFEPIKLQLKRDLKHWESVINKRKDAGKLGGLAKASKGKQELANLAVTDTVNVTVTDTVNDNDIYFKRENLTEFVLDGLENSTHLELVCKRTSLTLDQVKSKINDFKQIASVEYPKPIDLINHFIRWLKINKDNGNINKKHYYLSSPHGNWDGLLTEDEFKAKTLTNYWTLIKTV